MAVARDNTHLIDLLGVLLRFDLDRQHRGFDDAALQASLPSTHRLHGVNQDVAPLRLVLVGQAWPSGERGRVFFVGRFRLPERFPGIGELLEHVGSGQEGNAMIK